MHSLKDDVEVVEQEGAVLLKSAEEGTVTILKDTWDKFFDHGEEQDEQDAKEETLAEVTVPSDSPPYVGADSVGPPPVPTPPVATPTATGTPTSPPSAGPVA